MSVSLIPFQSFLLSGAIYYFDSSWWRGELSSGMQTHLIVSGLASFVEDYPLDLSILLSGGKETKRDFLSSGE